MSVYNKLKIATALAKIFARENEAKDNQKENNKEKKAKGDSRCQRRLAGMRAIQSFPGQIHFKEDGFVPIGGCLHMEGFSVG